MRRIIGILVFAFAFNSSSLEPLTAQGCPSISPFDSVPDGAGLQCLLDTGPLTLQLETGGQGYIVDVPIRLERSNQRLTSNTPGQYARLVAPPDLAEPMFRMRGDAFPSNFEMSFLILDGNKANRTRYDLCNGIYRFAGITAIIKGVNFYIHDNTFVNTMCGSSLEVSGYNFNVYNNTFDAAGFEVGTVPVSQHPYADGITLNTCVDSNITENRIYNATDVGIVVSVGTDSTTTNCNVSRNTIRNTTAYGFAGITNGGGVPHTGTSRVSDNVVEASYNKLAFGIWSGEGPWGAGYTPHIGLVSGNFISGAVVNLGVDNAGGGTISGNVVYQAQGNRGMLGCQWPAEYTVGNVSNMSVQPGSIYRTWNNICAPYVNPRPSARVTSPSAGSQFYSPTQSITINATASDPESGYIDHVDFYANGSKIGTDYSFPYSYTYNGPLPIGSFSLTAVAADSGGDGPSSNSNGISVATFVLTAPANGATLTAGTYTTVTTSTNGPVAFVDYYAYLYGYGWFYAGRGSGSPYALTLGPLTVGDYIIVGTANGDTNAQTPWHTVYVR
jgi:parallel beta-helix repeat protein